MAYPELSLVVPILNEAGNIQPLFDELCTVLRSAHISAEIIYVDDASTDASHTIISDLKLRHPTLVQSIHLPKHQGKACALAAGFAAARGQLIAQIDGDLQDNPSELPKFLRKIAEGNDLVVGWKQHRKDSWMKNIASFVFNLITNAVTGISLHDHNCGFKVYRSPVAKSLHLTGGLHRYIAVLAATDGYRIAEVPIEHRKRYNGVSKYGMGRIFEGAYDLVYIVMYMAQKRVMHRRVVA